MASSRDNSGSDRLRNRLATDDAPGQRDARHFELIDQAFAQAEKAMAQQVLGGSSTAPTRLMAGAPRAEPVGVFSLPGYRVVREIHRGGQGVVYEAVQESTGRTVAIKVTRAGPFATAADRARFDREVQILAQLKHPNIVTIHDSGRAFGCDYFVMDYIEGTTLDRWIADCGLRTADWKAAGAKQSAVRNPQSTMGKALRLFSKVCDAVNAAHLRGVIHRDLKPGNIRVDASGQPHILDFGLAKVVEDPAHGSSADAMTMTGQFIGSLPWASPEQAEGRLDELDLRTDVYALGVLLYQLLTGAFPYSISGSLRETTDNIVNKEARDPRQLNPALDVDIATIVLRCLRKRREERYETAGELARDIERFLRNEPIEARRDSMLYVLGKQLSRHRLAAALSTAILLAVVIGLGVSLALWRKAENAHTAEQEHRRLAELETAKSKAMNNFLIDVLGAADPERSLGPKSTVEELLESAAARLDRGALRDEPLVQATARATIGRTLLRLGLHERAAAQLEQALALRRADGATPVELATSLTDLGMLARATGDNQRTVALYREALEMIESAPEVQDKALAGALNNLGLALRSSGDSAGAAQILERSLALDRKTLSPDDPELAVSLNNLALVLRDAGQIGKAEENWQEALALLRKVHGDDNLRVAAVLESLSGVSLDRGQLDEAEARQREANDIRVRTVGNEHPHVAQGRDNLGHILSRKGDHAAAEPLHREALEMRRRLLGDDHPSVATSLGNLGLVLMKLGDYPGAESAFQEALTIRRPKLGDDHPSTLLVENNLASVMRVSGRPANAESLAREVVRRADAALPPQHRYRAIFRSEWGACLHALGSHTDAERELLAAHEQAAGGEEPDTALMSRIAEDLVQVYTALGNESEADQWRSSTSRDEIP